MVLLLPIISQIVPLGYQRVIPHLIITVADMTILDFDEIVYACRV
jgi:hypothetical protein